MPRYPPARSTHGCEMYLECFGEGVPLAHIETISLELTSGRREGFHPAMLTPGDDEEDFLVF